MVFQLPSPAVPAAVGVLIYTFVNLIGSSLIIWLTWTHNERLSYVACIAYFITISVLGSLIQQFHDYMYYIDISWSEFNIRLSDPSNPELIVGNGSQGMDLILFYIQYCCYSIEAMFCMFWSMQLAQSVYGLSEKTRLKQILRRLNNAGKIIAVAFPVITTASLQSKTLQSNFIGFMMVADLPLMVSLAIGSFLTFCILVKYVQSRKRSAGSQSQSQSHSAGTNNHNPLARNPRPHGLYDRWLLIRFTVAFAMLGIFEVTNTLFQVSAANQNHHETAAQAPDLSIERAKAKIALFMPGVTPGIMLFVVFGTTKAFRSHLYTTFVPRCWQGRNKALPLLPTSVSTSRSDSRAGLKLSPLFSKEKHARREGIVVEDRVSVRSFRMEPKRGPSSSSDEVPMLLLQRPESAYVKIAIRR